MANRTNKIPYPQTINNAQVETSAAKTTETDTTNAVLLYTAPSNAPAICTRLEAMAKTTTTAQRLKVYIAKAATPTVLHLIRNKLMPATTVSETVEPAPINFGYSYLDPLKLFAGDLLYVASGVANATTWNGEFEEYALA